MSKRAAPRVVLALVVVVIAVVATAVTADAGTRTVRTMTVTPSTGLVQGQSVHVSGRGFTPHQNLYVVECKTRPSGGAGMWCDETTVRGAVADDTGAYALDLPVNSELIGVLGKGGVNCTRADGFCSILALDPGAFSRRASAPISFSDHDVTSRFDSDQLSAMEQAASDLGVSVYDIPRIGSSALAYVLALTHTGPLTPPPAAGPHSITTDWPASDYAAISSIAAAHGTTVAQFQKAGALFLLYELRIG